MIIWSGDVEKKLIVRTLAAMDELHLSCWEAVVNDSEIEMLICFRDIVYDVRVMIPGYVVKSCGFHLYAIVI